MMLRHWYSLNPSFTFIHGKYKRLNSWNSNPSENCISTSEEKRRSVANRQTCRLLPSLTEKTACSSFISRDRSCGCDTMNRPSRAGRVDIVLITWSLSHKQVMNCLSRELAGLGSIGKDAPACLPACLPSPV